MTTLFCRNLNFSVDKEQLAQAFSEFGVERATVILDKETGRSRGFGFVEIETGDGAARAIEEMDGANWMGRTISVSLARARERGA